ncbi:hypothetical protein CIW52_34435 [Mycolicibacterium sp. P9-64]|uniref:hypothetical protein n=1 Tax=Mycolicibacterium sp. P9-64 TaxID=2024612 RepID=UPI0011EBE2CC|nr:hypothetical protein [Mycolicibacterium sp. P9-64]KAA0074263.1 hypothetical protein CIW52_34435 [Mycolicibacterium sp. P9-64]
MTLTANNEVACDAFTIEDISTGMYASGFGRVGDGRTFSFRLERQLLMVEVYRPRLAGPVPHAEDVVAVANHSVANVDVTDERSLSAAVRDAVADAQQVPRTAR